GGVQLGQVTFTGESASGWQTQSLSSPLTFQPGTVYVISVNANSFFVSTKSGLATQVVGGPFRTVADGANGVFSTTGGTFPTQSYSSSNYFVDLVGSPADVAAERLVDVPGERGERGRDDDADHRHVLTAARPDLDQHLDDDRERSGRLGRRHRLLRRGLEHGDVHAVEPARVQHG